MDDEPVFTGNDLRLMESLVYDANLEPSYEFLKGCLVWTDERPEGLTPAAYDKLGSLWIARSLLHRGLDFSDHPINPEYCRNLWERAIRQVSNWPGFKRLTLSEKDKRYYETKMNEASEKAEY
jgi:hypothetical protein